jgi:hypothetical protein
MEECGHVLKQFIQSGLMNSEECKTECSDKKLTQFMNKFMNIKISSFSWIWTLFTNKKMGNNGCVANL